MIRAPRARVGFEFGIAYAASKFGLEGWLQSLHAEVAPLGIATTIVNPGFFPTQLLTEQSTKYAKPSIEDYDERRAQQLEFWKAQNGRQSGDPAKLARALILIASQQPLPSRFIAGAMRLEPRADGRRPGGGDRRLPGPLIVRRYRPRARRTGPARRNDRPGLWSLHRRGRSPDTDACTRREAASPSTQSKAARTRFEPAIQPLPDSRCPRTTKLQDPW